MKLTKREYDYLKNQCGESDEDIDQIKRVICNRNLKITIEEKNGKERRISYVLAKRLLGWEQFIGAIDRASFHWSSAREIGDGRVIYFDASEFFKW